MKILIISNLFPSKQDPSYGTFVYNFVEQIKESHRFSIVDKCVIKGRTTSAYKKCLKYVKFYISILYRLFFHNYDIVYIHIITHAAIPLRFASLFKHYPFVFNIHGEDLLTKSRLSELFLKIVTPLLYKSKMVVVPSTYFKNVVQEKMPDIDEKLIYVSASGGVAMNFFINEDLHTSNSRMRIGYVSRIDRGKGWNLFIDAIRALTDDGICVDAFIVGTGSEVPSMLAMLQTCKLNNIHYLGVIPYMELPQFYASLDLFVFPTMLEESLGLVGLEAMACHVPVIGSKYAGLTDYLADGYNGFYFDRGCSISLKQSIIKYLQLNAESKQLMKQNAYQTAQKYSADNVSQKMISQLESIVLSGTNV